MSNTDLSKVPSQPLAVTVSRTLPKLTDEQLAKAEELAGKIDPKNLQLVLTFGEDAQGKVASFSETLLTNISLADSGETGEVLNSLQSTVRSVDPGMLRGPQTWYGKMFAILPGAESVQDRIDAFTQKKDGIQPTLNRLKTALGIEQEKAQINVEQIEALSSENGKYIGALLVAKGALTIAANRASEQYEEKRSLMSKSADITEASELKRYFDDLQRLDRRLYALEASIILANSNETSMQKVRDLLTYNFETLGEAKTIMLPSWQNRIGLTIIALRAKDQSEMVQAFRKATDNLFEGSADMINQIEEQQADMKKRTFIAAEVLAKINDSMATSITKALGSQLEAKKARDAGLELIKASQDRVVAAMKQAGQELVDKTAMNTTSAGAKNYDIAADLLLENRPISNK